MSESDFARERAERSDPESFELQKLRWRRDALAQIDAAALHMYRQALLMLMEWRAQTLAREMMKPLRGLAELGLRPWPPGVLQPPSRADE